MEIKAKKSLGQHFLRSPSVLAKIISAANVKSGEAILEIGPGEGVLTGALLKAGANVVAVEKDNRAYGLLKEKFNEAVAGGQLRIIHGDILDPKLFFNHPYSIVANIPYYITGAILEKFLEHEPRPNRMILLVQREVAERIVGHGRSAGGSRGAGSGKESILSISVKAFGTPRVVAKVPRGAFVPAPTVDSAILAIENISGQRFKDAGVPIEKFFGIIRAGFAHKRKFLIRNLEAILNAGQSNTRQLNSDRLKKIWQELNLNEKVRAEDMPLSQWFDIAKHLH